MKKRYAILFSFAVIFLISVRNKTKPRIFQYLLSSDVTGHDNYAITEINASAFSIGKVTVIENL